MIVRMKHQVDFRDERQVPALGQGTWKMGQSASRRTEEIKALRRGIELGMTVVDTAEMYDNEELVGEAIRECRNRVFLVSKVLPGHADRMGTKAACERSLAKLRTDYLDLYLLHWGGPHPVEETAGALADLQREGKIRAWGVSNMDVDDLERWDRAAGGRSCAANQVLYNLSCRGIEYDLLPWCRERRMPVMAYSPVDEGRLNANRALLEIARRHDVAPAQIALAWVLRMPGVIAIPKAGSVKHVEDNHRCLSLTLTEDDLRDLDRAFPPPGRKTPLEWR